MTPRLTTDYAKNYCDWTPIVKVIVENVVTCFLLGHSVDTDGRCNRDKVTVENAVNHSCTGRRCYLYRDAHDKGKTRPMLSDSRAINEDASPPEMRSAAVLSAACLSPCKWETT